MKKKRLFEEDMDKVLVGMNLKEANENKVKMDKPQQQIQKNEQKSLKPRKTNEERKKEVEEFGKMLQYGIKDYIESERYKELLDNRNQVKIKKISMIFHGFYCTLKIPEEKALFFRVV